jgi:hypothetical protein
MPIGRKAGVAALLCVASSVAQAQLKGENLIVVPPAGFMVGYSDTSNFVSLTEWVPSNETVHNWSEMVTVQIFFRRADLNPGPFLRTLQGQWLAACPTSTPASVMSDKANGYEAATMLLRCPRLAATSRPETTMFRAIKGKGSLYLVQRAIRSTGTPDEVERLKRYLAEVTVCEAGSRDRPCPDLKPMPR